MGRVAETPCEGRALWLGCPAPTLFLDSFSSAGEHEHRPFTSHPWGRRTSYLFFQPSVSVGAKPKSWLGRSMCLGQPGDLCPPGVSRQSSGSRYW